jgi:hypothetical protein
MLIDVLQVMCSFWSSLDPSQNFRIVRGRKKKGKRFIGPKDEVKDGFEKLSNPNVERKRQKWLLDGFALFLWHD